MLTLELALKSTALLSVACLTVWSIRRKSAALRHLIWTLAFAGLLLLPLFSVALPVLHVPVSKSLSESDLIFKTDVLAGAVHVSSLQTLDHPVHMPSVNWLLLLTLLWAAGAVLGLGQMLIGWLSLERMRLRAAVFAPPADGIQLLESPAGTMPMAYGLFRPIIFLPSDARQWVAERLRMVLRHELAHVKRGDGGTHVLARTALSIYWWNPLAWWAWREFLKEQERAADDMVLSDGAHGSVYATHLLEIARSMQSAASGGPVVAMAKPSQLAGRLAAILDHDRDRSVPGRASVIAAIVVAIGLVTPLAAMQDGAGKYTIDLLLQGDEARDKGKIDDARRMYDKFLSGNPSGVSAAKAYIHRGIVEILAKDFHAAITDFEHAQGVDLSSLSESLMWEAIANQRLNNVDEAARLFEGAVTAGDPRSPATATAMELESHFMEGQGQQEEATRLRKQAQEIRQTQPQSPGFMSGAPEYEHAVRAGGDVAPPKLLSKVEPEYTVEARAAGYSGVARLSVVVGADGATHEIRVTHGLGFGLDKKAIEAVSKWTFQPGMKNGNPVNVRASIEVSFRLL